ncbi:LysR family transcriptional regulator [Streptomyces sp. NPDC088194]|uniref:LysR family transcriptional regulator n=1 Tax=Streptomyces sp. NPDC088194 TaxID=3154931 RepID=UPI00344BFE8B
MDLDPRRLLVLHAITHHGGLAPAARALGHTRSAVSQQLASLEREVGLALVDRSGPRLELTAAGRLLAAAGERIAHELTSAAQQLGTANRGLVQGPVEIGAPSGVLARIAVPALRLLERWFPQVEPRFTETSPPEGLRRLRLGELDVLVVVDDRDTALPLPPAVRAQVLSEDEYRLVVPAAWGMPTAAELSGRPWISAPAHSARGRAFARFAAAHGVTPSVEHLADHVIAVKAMLAGQVGAAVLPAYLAARLDQVTVTGLPVTGSQITRTLYRTGHGDGATAAKAAVDALQQAARDHAEALTLADQGSGDIIIRPLRDPADPPPTAPRGLTGPR